MNKKLKYVTFALMAITFAYLPSGTNDKLAKMDSFVVASISGD